MRKTPRRSKAGRRVRAMARKKKKRLRKTKVAIFLGATLALIVFTITDNKDAPAQHKCWSMSAVGRCQAVKSIATAPGTIKCNGNSRVTVTLEVVETDQATDLPALTGGLTSIDGTVKEIRCNTATRTDKVLTAIARSTNRCIAGMVSKNIIKGANGAAREWRTFSEPTICCGPRAQDCRCDDNPCVKVGDGYLSGHETWRDRMCEDRPDLC